MLVTRLRALPLLMASLGLLACRRPSPVCHSDLECKADRVCVQGSCAERSAVPAVSSVAALTLAAPRMAPITKAIPVGQWPEGIAVVGTTAWIACSGSRLLKQVDLEGGKVIRSAKAGTFPVIAVADRDTVFAPDYNSGRGLFAIDAKGAVALRGRTPDHPEAAAVGDGVLYVLLHQNNSSINSSVLRVEAGTGKQTRSSPTGEAAEGIAVGHGRVWVASRNKLTGLDPTTLAVVRTADIGTATYRALANSNAVYVELLEPRAILRFDPSTGNMTRATIGETFMSAANDSVVATLGESGTLTLFDPATLAVRQTLSVGRQVRGGTMVFYRDDLLVTSKNPDNENGDDGTLLVIKIPG